MGPLVNVRLLSHRVSAGRIVCGGTGSSEYDVSCPSSYFVSNSQGIPCLTSAPLT